MCCQTQKTPITLVGLSKEDIVIEDGKVVQALFSAVDEVNRLLPPEDRLNKSTDVVLYGESGKLDSLGLVNLIVAVEEKVEEEFGVRITLVSDEVMSQENNAFETLGTLIRYVSLLLERELNE